MQYNNNKLCLSEFGIKPLLIHHFNLKIPDKLST
jgi:hypothetical protein